MAKLLKNGLCMFLCVLIVIAVIPVSFLSRYWFSILAMADTLNCADWKSNLAEISIASDTGAYA